MLTFSECSQICRRVEWVELEKIPDLAQILFVYEKFSLVSSLGRN